MTSIRWAPGASDGPGGIDDRYARIDPELAASIAELILKAAERLSDFFRAGSAVDAGGRRKWGTQGTPYRIFNRASSGEVSILRVPHVAQDRTERP